LRFIIKWHKIIRSKIERPQICRGKKLSVYLENLPKFEIFCWIQVREIPNKLNSVIICRAIHARSYVLDARDLVWKKCTCCGLTWLLSVRCLKLDSGTCTWNWFLEPAARTGLSFGGSEHNKVKDKIAVKGNFKLNLCHILLKNRCLIFASYLWFLNLNCLFHVKHG
jgi:hypothetical protein